jgi:carbonic anhydrase
MELIRRRFTGLVRVLVSGGAGRIAGAAETIKKVIEARQKMRTPEEIWADLVTGNKRFMAGRPQAREMVRTRQELVKGQHPQVIVLGCVDSRVSPELVFDKNLGQLFVVRTAGNVVDPVALRSIEYASEHLHARLLVVLGHEKCRAVVAAPSGEKMPAPNLDGAGKITSVAGKFGKSLEGDDLIARAVDANVHQSASDLLKNSSLIRREVQEGKLSIYKTVHKLATGEVVRLG